MSKLTQYLGIGATMVSLNCSGTQSTVNSPPNSAQNNNRISTNPDGEIDSGTDISNALSENAKLDEEYARYRAQSHLADDVVIKLMKKDAMAVRVCLSLENGVFQQSLADWQQLIQGPEFKECESIHDEVEKDGCTDQILETTNKVSAVRYYRKYSQYIDTVHKCLREVERITASVRHEDRADPDASESNIRAIINKIEDDIRGNLPEQTGEYLVYYFCENDIGKSANFRNPYFAAHRNEAETLSETFKSTHPKQIAACAKYEPSVHRPPRQESIVILPKSECFWNLYKKDPHYNEFQHEVDAARGTWYTCLKQVDAAIKK
jgi:hypothetical protein